MKGRSSTAIPLAGWFVWTALVISPVGARALAGELQVLQAALRQRHFSDEEPLERVRVFIDQRVARLPEFASRHDWERYAGHLRQKLLDEVVYRGEAARWRDTPAQVEWLESLHGGPGYRIRKLRYEALPGLWIPALLYEPEDLVGRVPVVLNLGGHEAEGKSVGYRQLRCINLAKRGMLALHPEWLGMGQLRAPGFAHGRMNQLDLCGSSGLSVFYLAMRRGLDLLCAHDHADTARVAVTGLSGGGWQTAWLSALDERVTAANPVAGYTSLRISIRFQDMGDSEQAPSDFAAIADGIHLTALRAPWPTLLTYNAADECCFKADHTVEPLVSAARPIFALYGAKDRLRWHVNHVPGTHNYEKENREVFYQLLDDYFYPHGTRPIAEPDSTGEIKSAAELEVPLPPENLNFQALAARLAQALPRSAEIPRAPKLHDWQTARRQRLRELLRLPDEAARQTHRRDEQQADLHITRFALAWHGFALPVTLFQRAAGKERLAIVLSDEGAAALAGLVERLLNDGWQVAAVDPMFIGQSQLTGSDPQVYFALAVASVGQRPLGIQAGQLAALARHLRREQGTSHLFARGRRASLAALAAAAIEPEAIAGLELGGSLGSLKQLIEENRTVEEYPELFPFGLLAEFDVVQMAALVAPRELRFAQPDERARKEMAPLKEVYTDLGSPEPVIEPDR